jgi:hypothetical protein
MSTSALDARSGMVLASGRNVSRGHRAGAGGRAEVPDSGSWDPLGGVQKLIVTIVATMTFAACSAGTVTAPRPSLSPSATASPAVEAQVLAAWRAEHTAYADALVKLDPSSAALAQTAIDPALRRTVAYIAAAKAQGIVVHGSQDLGNPRVVSLGLDTAIVEACVHDGLLLLNAKTSKPVPGLAGQVTWNFEHTTLQHVEGVGWMVADNVVRQAAKESVCVGN